MVMHNFVFVSSTYPSVTKSDRGVKVCNESIRHCSISSQCRGQSNQSGEARSESEGALK